MYTELLTEWVCLLAPWVTNIIQHLRKPGHRDTGKISLSTASIIAVYHTIHAYSLVAYHTDQQDFDVPSTAAFAYRKGPLLMTKACEAPAEDRSL